MRKKLLEELKVLCTDLVNAGARKDEATCARLFAMLRKKCNGELKRGRRDPLLYELMGDFSPDPSQSIRFYRKAIGVARNLGRPQYYLLMELALRQLDAGDVAGARRSLNYATLDALKWRDDVF